jgi:hypothetical protein
MTRPIRFTVLNRLDADAKTSNRIRVVSAPPAADPSTERASCGAQA